VIGTPVAAIMSALTGWLGGMTFTNTVPLGLLPG
jgi:fructose PTS system EIIBC or EIIC component